MYQVIETIDIHLFLPQAFEQIHKEDNFVSGCTLDCISLNGEAVSLRMKRLKNRLLKFLCLRPRADGPEGNKVLCFITGMGRGIGSIVNVFYQAGRDTLDAPEK